MFDRLIRERRHITAWDHWQASQGCNGDANRCSGDLLASTRELLEPDRLDRTGN
jgi:hypothetical protein